MGIREFKGRAQSAIWEKIPKNPTFHLKASLSPYAIGWLGQMFVLAFWSKIMMKVESDLEIDTCQQQKDDLVLPQESLLGHMGNG